LHHRGDGRFIERHTATDDVTDVAVDSPMGRDDVGAPPRPVICSRSAVGRERGTPVLSGPAVATSRSIRVGFVSRGRGHDS
jgi:hypothetical protein